MQGNPTHSFTMRKGIQKIVKLSAILCCVTVHAEPLPKITQQVPQELQGDYFLTKKVGLDKKQEVFTNQPPFVLISSNRVERIDGQTRAVKGVIQATSKGTNVYVLSFKDQGAWLITSNSTPPGLIIIEPKKVGSKEGTIFELGRRSKN